MKILMLNTLYYPYSRGGAEISIQLIAEQLVKLGFEVVVVATGKQSELKNVNGVKVYYVKLMNLYWQFIEKTFIKILLNPIWHLIDSLNPLMASEVAKIIDIENPDIVHTNNVQGFSVLVWRRIKKRGIPIIHTIRDYYLICPKTLMFNKKVNCRSQCFPCRVYSTPKIYFSHIVDYVVGITNFVVDQHTELDLFRNAKKAIIFNSYDTNNLSQKNNISQIVRYGYIGRIAPEKGIELLLNTISTWDDCKYFLTIAGKGDAEYVQQLSSFHCRKNIKFTGFTPAEDFLKQIDVLIVPSIWNEPFGRIIIEAYAHGIPVIASKRGGIPDLIDEGITGYLFEPNEPEELLYYLKKFVNNPDLIRLMSKSCLIKSKEFSSMNTAQKYISIYESLVHLKTE